jgi:putative transposase
VVEGRERSELVRNVLGDVGPPPAPQRDRLSWRSFLQIQGDPILACDFFHRRRRQASPPARALPLPRQPPRRYLSCTGKPAREWMLQQARNLLMDLDDRGRQARFLIHDRNTKFPAAFGAIFADENVKIIRTPIQAPNANAHVERWIGSVRRECLTGS